MLNPRPLALALLLLAGPAAAQEPCKVIVNPANPATQIERAALVAIFKGAMPRWKDASPVQAVDQSIKSPARAAFTEKMLRDSLMAMQTYWFKQLQQGRVPPMVKASDQEVAAYVKANRGAIGYVSEGFALDDSVKVLKVVD
jgi:ABC-type phosphate transport system substrate-binding protein